MCTGKYLLYVNFFVDYHYFCINDNVHMPHTACCFKVIWAEEQCHSGQGPAMIQHQVRLLWQSYGTV